MKSFSYCVDCGEKTSGSKRCPKCGQIEAWTRRDKRKAVSEMRAGIVAEFKEYGVHYQCRYCRRQCKQWAAPNSQIVYCPRMKNEVLKAHPILYLTDML